MFADRFNDGGRGLHEESCDERAEPVLMRTSQIGSDDVNAEFTL